MSSSANPRFRVRAPDGYESAVESVEELQRRIERADIDPAAELFDVGTGEWSRLSEVPVFLFILEELQFEERLPAMYESLLAKESEGKAGASSFGVQDDPDLQAIKPDDLTVGEPAVEEREGEKSRADDSDLGMDLDLVDFEFEPPSPPMPGVSESAPFKGTSKSGRPRDDPRTPVDSPGDAAADESSPQIMSSSDGGLIHPETDPKALAQRTEAAPKEDGAEIWTPESGEAPDLSGMTLRRLPMRTVAIAGGGLVLTALIVVAGMAFFGGETEIGEPIAIPDPAGLSPAPDPPIPPPGLEAPAALVLSALAGHYAEVGDSLRAGVGLPASPPREWLTGLYFANASRYGQVRAFWENYSAFLFELAPADEAVYREGVRAGIERLEGLDTTQRQQLESYFEERHTALSAHRAERYGYLAETARAALALHDLLERHENEIVYSPALGQGVSADPILEAAIPEGPIRREIDRALDRIFQALNRSRGGGRPSPDGLRADLFLVFGEG